MVCLITKANHVGQVGDNSHQTEEEAGDAAGSVQELK